jgi:hypothetical protein
MKRTTERGKAENIYKSYQKQEKPAKSGTMTESNTSKSKAVPRKAKEDDDSGEDDGEDPKDQQQGHEMTPVRKRMDVQVIAKSSYGPIQEMPTVQERKLELSIDDAIGTLLTMRYLYTEEHYVRCVFTDVWLLVAHLVYFSFYPSILHLLFIHYDCRKLGNGALSAAHSDCGWSMLCS